MAELIQADFAEVGVNVEIVEATNPAGLDTPKVVRPPVPILARRVRIGQQGKYTRPVVPAFRTSADGRIALRGELQPLLLEKLKKAPLLHQDPQLSGELFGPGVGLGDVVHPSVKQNYNVQATSTSFICQRSLAQPRVCANHPDQDCYDLSIVVHVDVSGDGKNGVVLESIPVSVRVASPKTVNAAVVAVNVAPTSEWKVTPRLPVTLIAEMVPSADGHVLVGRVLSVQDEGVEEPGIQATYRLDGGGTNTAAFSLFYAYAEDPCDVTQWMKRNDADVFQSLRPLPAAPYDRRMKDRGYGLAAQPLRSLGNEVLGERDILAGSYPWVDREVNNVFFSHINPMPIDPTVKYARYPIAREGGAVKQVGSPPRGFSVIGSWTQGKHVLLDGIINNEDYGFQSNETHQLSLYSSPDGPLAVRVNAGGKNGTSELGLKNNRPNNHHLESLENVLGMHLRSLPVTARDVVWNVNRGLASDEIAFDDFLDPHVVLFAEMNASAVKVEGSARHGRYQDGFSQQDGKYVHNPASIRLQNAAASLVYPIASHGKVEGDARVEPVALGGVRGRGLWLGPDASARFTFPKATNNVAPMSFYTSVFVDARDELTGEKHLMRFESDAGTVAVTLEDGALLRVRRATGETATFDLSCAAVTWKRRFHHVGVLFGDDGVVTAFLDGNPVGEQVLDAPVRLAQGDLVIGGAYDGLDGVRGWYDEARVVLQGNAGQLDGMGSVEMLCNYARGTTVAVPAGAPLRERADRFPFAVERAQRLGVVPTAKQGIVTCAVDYTSDIAVGRNRVPEQTTSLRDPILHEGTPLLVHNQPRVDTREVSFCRSCHVDAAEKGQRPPTMTLDALVAAMDSVNTADDPRTQPMQPPSLGNGPAMARGVIPPDWILGSNGESYPANATKGPIPILRWILR